MAGKTDLDKLKTKQQKEIETVLRKKKTVKVIVSLITLVFFTAYILITIYSSIFPEGR